MAVSKYRTSLPAFSTWRTAFTIFSWGNLSGGKCRETNRVSHDGSSPHSSSVTRNPVSGWLQAYAASLPPSPNPGREISFVSVYRSCSRSKYFTAGKTPPKTDILPPEFSYAKASLLIPAPHLFCIIYWNLLHEEILTKLIVRACPGLFAMGQLLLCRQLPGAIVRLFGAKGAIPEAPAIFTALLCQFANV